MKKLVITLILVIGLVVNANAFLTEKQIEQLAEGFAQWAVELEKRGLTMQDFWDANNDLKKRMRFINEEYPGPYPINDDGLFIAWIKREESDIYVTFWIKNSNIDSVYRNHTTEAKKMWYTNLRKDMITKVDPISKSFRLWIEATGCTLITQVGPYGSNEMSEYYFTNEYTYNDIK